jgi:hypothetical protein
MAQSLSLICSMYTSCTHVVYMHAPCCMSYFQTTSLLHHSKLSRCFPCPVCHEPAPCMLLLLAYTERCPLHLQYTTAQPATVLVPSLVHMSCCHVTNSVTNLDFAFPCTYASKDRLACFSACLPGTFFLRHANVARMSGLDFIAKTP